MKRVLLILFLLAVIIGMVGARILEIRLEGNATSRGKEVVQSDSNNIINLNKKNEINDDNQVVNNAEMDSTLKEESNVTTLLDNVDIGGKESIIKDNSYSNETSIDDNNNENVDEDEDDDDEDDEDDEDDHEEPEEKDKKDDKKKNNKSKKNK